MSEKRILLGNGAITKGAYEAGVKVSTVYPGTPSMEVSELLVRYDEIYTEWAPNEGVVTEVVIGTSVTGMHSVRVMEHMDMNMIADPLYTMMHTGARGGLVLMMADDPGMYDSQSKQDSRVVARAAMVPIVKPSDSAGAKEFMKHTYDLSGKYDTSVILRNTTRLSYSQGLVEPEKGAEPLDISYERDMARYVMVPGNAIERHVMVEARMRQMAEDANSFPISRVEYNDLSVSFITNGIAYQYMKEAMLQAPVPRLRLLNSLSGKLIGGFTFKVNRLYIFEELEFVAEEQVKSWGIRKAVGKEVFTVQGEYSANLIGERMLGRAPRMDKAAQVPARLPMLCPGCPHRSAYVVLSELKIHTAGDIDCYTLGAVVPLSVIDTTICMGASISALRGMGKTKGREYIKNWVTVVGDSTFMYTGIDPFINMAYSQAAGTVITSDNPTTGMTGRRGHAATGKTLKGQAVPAINIYGLCESLGIEHVYEADSLNQTELERITREGVTKDAISVIITRMLYALLKGIKFPNKCRPLPGKCKKHGACLRPGCPALAKNEDGTTSINGIMCNGCGLREQLCKFDVTNLVKAGE